MCYLICSLSLQQQSDNDFYDFRIYYIFLRTGEVV